MANCERVASLKCSICSLLKNELEPMRNFKPAFIEDTTYTNDHVATDFPA